MAQVIKLKRTSIAGNIPDTSNIEVGELAFNSNDKSLFIRGDSNAIVAIHDESTLHIDTTNNRIGIGTTNPTYKLHVAGTSYLSGGIQLNSTDKITIGNPNQFITAVNDTSLTLATDGSASLTILDNGNVGIGTTSPSQIFTVENNSGIFRINTSTSTYPRIEIGSTSGTTAAIINRTTSTQNIIFGETSDSGNYVFRGGNVGIGTASPGHSLHVVSAGNGEIKAERTSGAAILTQAQASLGRFGTSTNHNLQFMTNSSGHMTITTAGRVGIGTTSPGRPLDVIAATNILLELESTNAGGNSRMVFTTNSGSNWNLGALNDGSFSIFDAVGGANSFIIETGANGNTLVIDSQSRVGIGTAAPSSKLHISESADGAKLRLTRGGVSEWDFSIGNTSTLTGVGSGALEILPQNGSTANELAIGTAGTTAPLVHITNSQNYFSKKIGIGTTSVDEKLHVEGGNIKIEAGAVSTTRGLTIAHTGQTGNLTKLEQSAGGNPHGILHTTERQLRISAGSG